MTVPLLAGWADRLSGRMEVGELGSQPAREKVRLTSVFVTLGVSEGMGREQGAKCLRLLQRGGVNRFFGNTRVEPVPTARGADDR